jgi:glycosyltransferase involved in cell wall biosynthesis
LTPNRHGSALRRLAPRSIRERLSATRGKLEAHLYRRRLEALKAWPPPAGIEVCYGGVLDQAAGGIVQGGRVKLVHLQDRFPERRAGFNILYLVSSAQPPHSVELARWARSRGAKFIWNQNGVAYPAWAGSDSELTNAPMRELLGLADYVIYQSEFCRASADRYAGRTSAKCEILYNCVDTEKFSPRKIPLPGPPWVILAAGSHRQAERVISVLEALAHARQSGADVRLILAGGLEWEGAERETRDAVRRFGVQSFVDIRGSYSQAEAPKLYREAHVLLHTKYKDPCPTVVIEAMACGLPVVGSRSGGMPELVGDEAGILIAVDDSWERMCYPSAQELSDAVLRILSDLSEWRDRARRRAVRMFGKDFWIKRHAEIFSAVLEAV